MIDKVGGGAKGPEEIGAGAVEAAGAQSLGEGAEAALADGAPSAKRTARPKSFNMSGLDLRSQLEAKLAGAGKAVAAGVGGPKGAGGKWPLDPAGIARALEQAFPGSNAEPTSGPEMWALDRPGQPVAFIEIKTGRLAMSCGEKTVSRDLKKGDDVVALLKDIDAEMGKQHPHDPLPPAGAPRPRPLVSGPIPKGPAGPPPRPHAGAAAARQLEALLSGRPDATKLAGELYAKIQHLVTVDRREGIQLNPNATEGEINTFKVMIQTLAADGKLDDLRRGLHGPSAGPRLVYGSVEEVMSFLVGKYGGKGEQKAWGR